jgi:hypothetical protein
MILGGLCADAGRKLSHDSHIMTQTGGSEVLICGTAVLANTEPCTAFVNLSTLPTQPHSADADHSITQAIPRTQTTVGSSWHCQAAGSSAYPCSQQPATVLPYRTTYSTLYSRSIESIDSTVPVPVRCCTTVLPWF